MTTTRKILISAVERERFFKKIEVSGTGCHLFSGAKNRNGYGLIVFVREGKKIDKTTHRLSWEIHNGDIPEGLCVCHKCDVRNCVNPDHLFLGTLAENTKDMYRKNRGIRGTKCHTAKLTERKVSDIRKLRSEGVTRKEICRIYGICSATASMVSCGRSWKSSDISEPPTVGFRLSDITKEKAAEIKAMREKGYSLLEVAEHFGVSAASVSRIASNKWGENRRKNP